MVGAASILAGVLYTGGPRPYGYEGLGELFVFLFFGVVAVAGSYYVQAEELRWEAFALAVPVGLLAAAILVVNNVRDIDTDRRAGKRTLAVKLGSRASATLFVAMLCGRLPRRRSRSAAGGLRPGCCCRSLTLPLAPPLVRTVSDPHRRARAERRAGGHRAPARGLLAAAAGGRAALVTTRRSSACGCRSRCRSRS